MKWASAISTTADLRRATDEVIDTLAAALDPDRPDLVFVFCTPEHAAGFEGIARALDRRLGEAAIVGTMATGVIGDGREVEFEPSIAMAAGVLPDVIAVPVHVEADSVAALSRDPGEWWRHLDLIPEQQPAFLILADPYTTDVDQLCRSLDTAFPGAAKVGGLASGGQAPSEHQLLVDGKTRDRGAVVLAIHGDVVVDTLVAQGCRPVGDPMVVTACAGNLIRELDGDSAAEVLGRQLQRLAAHDRALLERSPHIGLAIDPVRSTRRRGDFLVRNLLGVDPRAGGVVVSANLAEGLTVQLHVRDAGAARLEIDELLERYCRRGPSRPVASALVFSCLGRGRAFYHEPHHDTGRIRHHLGPVATGGFFCTGEIGPVHARTWLHGYTTAAAFFREKGWS